MKFAAAAILFLSLSNAHAEKLGTVSFPTSCSPSLQASFNRGVALLHDFWYEEAEKQFEQIAASDPACSIAHWGVAMSIYHQIWNRPDAKTMAHGWSEIQKAESPQAQTPREREYIEALKHFYRPGSEDYQARAEAYSKAMSQLYAHNAGDVDAAAFYALSLLATSAPNDTTLANNRKALEILKPLFDRYPDHPGLAHYIIHACDNPTLAQEGLHAAERYGAIAPSAPHAVHMPGHIFARLGMWQQDIDSNLASVAASEAAGANHQSGAFDQLHADDFLLYAYLQSGQDANARALVEKTSTLLTRFESMPHMSTHGMTGMFPRYRNEFATIYPLEMHNWPIAAELQPAPGSRPLSELEIWWARTLAAGHLHQPASAKEDLARYDALIAELKKGDDAYVATSTFEQIEHGELLAWTHFAENKPDQALQELRESADLQHKVGQAEVDIPAREMLADMLLELNRPKEALVEYEAALKESPNRLNGLYGAGRAAEAAGDLDRANQYYSQLMKITANGSQSQRAEFAHVREFMATKQASAR